MAIRINGITGPKLDASVSGTYLFTTNTPSIVSYSWSIVSAPPTNTASLTGAATATATLIPSSEGTYLVRLTAVTGGGTIQETTVLAVPSITSGLRVPAYAETIEAGSTGWDQGAGNMLRALDLAREQPTVIACSAAQAISIGQPVTIGYDPSDPTGSPGSEVKLTTTPGERAMPFAFDDVDPRAPLVGFAIGTPSGASASPGDVVLVRVSGLFQGLSFTRTTSVDYPFLYPDGAGGFTDAIPDAESKSRCIGKVVRWSSGTPGSGTVDVMVYGDRVPRIKSIEFGCTTGFGTPFPAYLSIGMVAASGSVVFGQYCPALDSPAATILAGARIWAATTGTSATTFQVKNANTTASIGSSITLAGSSNSISAGIWTPVDVADPFGMTGQLVSGSSSPQNIAATLTFWSCDMSTQYVTGVLQTGAPRALGVPYDSRHGLQIVQGETLTLIMRVLTPAGVPVPVSGRDFRMTVRKNPRDLTGLAGSLGSARPDLGPEYWQFGLPFASTASFRPGVLCYDIWTRLADDREALIPTSPLYVSAAAEFSMLEPT